MKIAILNDTHCGARNSAPWMIDYQRRFYEEVFWPKIDELGIKHIMHLGDYYESRKTGASIEAQIANRQHFIYPFHDRGMEMKVIVGNHDAFFKNHNETNSLTILLEDLPKIEAIEYAQTFEDWGKPICLVPWITKENFEHTRKVIDKTPAEVCMGHFEFYGFPLQRGGTPCISDQSIQPDLVEKFKLVLSGHFHTRSFQNNIAYLGSQMEFTWADCNDPKYFHIYDTETYEVNAILNPITMFRKIFASDVPYHRDFENKFVQLIRDGDMDDEDFNTLVKELQNFTHEVIVTDTTLDKENVSVDMTTITDTPDLIKEYVDKLEIDLDKIKLVSMMENLYREAAAV